ncbi:MAG TPA: DUF3883 domain-containing protein [Candidatus Aquicultor sp.]|jgi:hypothetical protein
MKNVTNQIKTSKNEEFQEIILHKTLGQIHTFLDEIANGTSNYKSLHNLTEQVEHQYHGRFLIELIQNAHDALLERGEGEDERRIELSIMENEAPFGALYVANDGKPFSASNFESLSNLGQSDKDPEKSIGNKGIGFRSVLEISKSPEIYSRRRKESLLFDGFCFRFNPFIVQEFETSIDTLLEGNNAPSCPLDRDIPLVSWSNEKYIAFRGRCKKSGKGWLRKELKHLSPYLLPEPIRDKAVPQKVLEYEKQGYASVIRLPFINEKARELALTELKNLNENTVLFLDRVRAFQLVTNQYNRKFLRLEASRENDPENGSEVSIREESAYDNEAVKTERRFWLWEERIGDDDKSANAEALAAAVVELPGKWPELASARISVAVRLEESPEDGILNIYLPTGLSSGCSAHFSAPFYGDMSRTDVDFSQPLNMLLLRSIARKVTGVIFNSLVGRGEDEAAAIIDLVSYADGAAGERWWSTISTLWKEEGINIADQNICLTDKGWAALKTASILSVVEDAEVLSPSLLRESACYPAFIEALSSRMGLVKQIYRKISIGSYATDQQLADTIEKAATILHASDGRVDWNGFWHDVESILEGRASLLKGKKVLLGTDGQLHSVGERSAVFFRPMKLGLDDEIQSEEAIEEIPVSLRPFISFLNESITTHTARERGGYASTPIHTFLSSDLVKQFGVEHIFRSVLIPIIPDLPVSLRSENGKLCRDILQWGLKLIFSLVARDRGENATKLLARLPAPCRSGWYQMDETTFGTGWDDQSNGTLGKDLDLYLSKVNTSECQEASKRLLLPPDSKYWGGLADRAYDLLKKAGVFRGLRPERIQSTGWTSVFWVGGYREVMIPEKGPQTFWEDCWKRYRRYVSKEIASPYSGNFRYVVKHLYSLPGLDRYGDFDGSLRVVLMRILLDSIPFQQLHEDWEELAIEKLDGERHRFTIKSPLKFFFEETAWIADAQEDSIDFFCPRERWLVPSTVLAGRSHHYDCLKPLPSAIITIMEKNPALVSTMRELGMPLFDLEIQTPDARLLDDLAHALADPAVDIANLDVFLGMVRNAWTQLYPKEGNSLPETLVVRRGSNTLEATAPSDDDPVFLPDATEALHDSLELHSKPIIAIEFRDAKRLKDFFLDSYGNAVQLASELKMQPLVNGKAWNEGTDQPFASNGLEWLPPVVLSVFAYAGQQNRGTGTKAFQKAMDSLRSARVQWVDTVEIGLWRDDYLVANMPVRAFWHVRENTLIAEEIGRQKISLFSEALSTVVERADLPIPLKLVLGNLVDNAEPSQKEICEALQEVGISQDRYAEVQQRWLGNLSWTIKVLRPIIHLLEPGVDTAALVELNTDDQVESYLKALELRSLGWEKVLEIARASRGLQQTGEYLFEILGESAQLERWNAVLAPFGESPIEISGIEEQFKLYLDSARKPLRAIIRRILNDNDAAGRFLELEDCIHEFGCPDDWPRRFWNIKFRMVMEVVTPALEAIGASTEELDAVTQAESLDDLFVRLSECGLEPKIDPIEIHSANYENVKKELVKLQKAVIVWCERNKALPGMWADGVNSLMNQLEEYLDEHAFLNFWGESSCLNAIRSLPREDDHIELWDVIDTEYDVSGVISSLKVLEEDLHQADESLQRQRLKLEKEKRMVQVCGQPFENTSDNLTNLWDHLEQNLHIEEVSGFDIRNWTDLKQLKSKRKKRVGNGSGINGRKRSGVPPRMTQAMKNLVGLTGEIYVYRLLQQTYGTDIITPDCWVSENSKHKFPKNRTDDGYGYDFKVLVDGKIHFIEVKASTGEDGVFELGSSEVQLAVRLADKRNEIFSIFHVMNALSESPTVKHLPNPYNKRFRQMFRIEEAGLRVRYEAEQEL